MQPSDTIPTWDFSPAIGLLKALSCSESRNASSAPLVHSKRTSYSEPPLVLSQSEGEELSLGNFSRIWEYLSSSRDGGGPIERKSLEEDTEHVAKEVRWRDEVSRADLEDSADTDNVGAASRRTRIRAARRARARERANKAALRQIKSYETATENEPDQELDRLRRSPDRRAVIQDILHRPSKSAVELPSPPTSSSAPKETSRIFRKESAISNPFQWSASTSHASPHRRRIYPLGNLSHEQRVTKLITRLVGCYTSESKYLKNEGLVYPEFTPLNTSDSGIHVFIDISNVRLTLFGGLRLSLMH